MNKYIRNKIVSLAYNELCINKKEDEFIKFVYLADQHFPNQKYENIANNALGIVLRNN